MGFLRDLFDAIFSRKKEKTFSDHNKNHQSCDFKIVKFNEHKRPPGYGKDNANKHKVDELTFDVEVEEAPGGGKGRYKPPPASTTTTTTYSGPVTSTTTTTTQPPAPSLGATILLDFDGATVSGTSWNTAGDIVAAPANLTQAEQDIIFNNAVQDYAQFNVLVTMDQNVYNSAPATKRIRCIITETNEWYGTGAGGVAYTGSWNWGDNTPCWVFSKLLGYNTKYIQEATSHEVGHTFGLRHQAVWDANCVMTSSYNQGGNGEAPIMGVGYYQPDVHWWIGPTTQGCTIIQDDVLVLKSKVGLKS